MRWLGAPNPREGLPRQPERMPGPPTRSSEGTVFCVCVFFKNVCIFDWVFLAVAVFLYFQEPGLPFLVVHGLLIAAVSLVAECRLH